MAEDINGVMVPDSTMLRELHHTFHYGKPAAFALSGDDGPLDPVTNLEPIDDDPTIETLLAAEEL